MIELQGKAARRTIVCALGSHLDQKHESRALVSSRSSLVHEGTHEGYDVFYLFFQVAQEDKQTRKKRLLSVASTTVTFSSEKEEKGFRVETLKFEHCN